MKLIVVVVLTAFFLLRQACDQCNNDAYFKMKQDSLEKIRKEAEWEKQEIKRLHEIEKQLKKEIEEKMNQLNKKAQ